MGRAFVYVRVSSSDQVDSLSLEHQARVCRDLAISLNLELGKETNCEEPGIFCDAASAFKLQISERTGGSQLLKALHAEDTVIMYDISRGWRSSLDFARQASAWVSMNVAIRFVAMPGLDLTTANGRLTAAVLAAYAEWKSGILSERVKDGMAAKKAATSPKPQTDLPGDAVFSTGDGTRSKPMSTPESRAVLSVLREPGLDEAAPRKSSGFIHGYVRVSSSQQDVQSQVAPVREYMQRIATEGPEIGHLFEEPGVSASKFDLFERPAGKQLLAELKPGDHFVFLRPARAFRSVRDLVNSLKLLADRQITVHIAESGMRSGDVNFELLTQIMTLMAEIEAKEIGRRRRSATIERIEHGVIPSSPNQKLQRWLRVIREPGRPQTFVVDHDYIEACKLVRGWKETEKISFTKCFERLEEKIAAETGRRTIPRGGVPPKAMRKWIREAPNEEARKSLQFLLERWEKHNKNAKSQCVQAYYSSVDVQRMVKDLEKYEEYLEALKAERNGEIEDADSVLIAG